MNMILILYLVIVTAAFTIPVMYATFRESLTNKNRTIWVNILEVLAKIVIMPIFLLMVGYSYISHVNENFKQKELPE